MTMKILGGRRWKRRWWRRCSTSGRSVAQRGGGGGCGGARKHSEGSRGRRWLRWCSSVAAAPLGSERERETEEGESSGESEGRSGRRVASSGASLGRPRRKQEVARGGGSRRWPGQRRRAPRLASARPPGRGGRGQRRRRWAGPAGGTGPALVAARVRPGKWPRWPLSPFFYFVSLFYFCSFVSDLVYSPNHFNKSCK